MINHYKTDFCFFTKFLNFINKHCVIFSNLHSIHIRCTRNRICTLNISFFIKFKFCFRTNCGNRVNKSVSCWKYFNCITSNRSYTSINFQFFSVSNFIFSQYSKSIIDFNDRPWFRNNTTSFLKLPIIPTSYILNTFSCSMTFYIIENHF